jgi:hypothetical protein
MRIVTLAHHVEHPIHADFTPPNLETPFLLMVDLGPD